MKLTPKQKEALSYTPLYLGWSEIDLNQCSWGSNWQKKSFTRKTIDSLMEKGLLKFRTDRSKFGTDEPDETEVLLTDKAKEMGFVENINAKDNEHTIFPKEKKRNTRVNTPGTLKKGKLFEELEVLRIIADREGMTVAEEFLCELIRN